MTIQLEKDEASMACLEWFLEESLSKRTWQHSIGLQSGIKPQDFWNNVLYTEKSKVKVMMHSAVYRKPQQISKHTPYCLSSTAMGV